MGYLIIEPMTYAPAGVGSISISPVILIFFDGPPQASDLKTSLPSLKKMINPPPIVVSLVPVTMLLDL